MATDATGSPTSLGIPKYDTSVDAPSGLGFNAAMDAIDALLGARVTKPSGLTTGDVPVWNGSAWVRPTGTASSTVFLRGDGSWASVSTPTKAFHVAGPVTPSQTNNMQGINQQITPVMTGNILAIITGDSLSSNGGGAQLRPSYGTGTPPINGAAVTGTAWKTNAEYRIGYGQGANEIGFTVAELITGLTLGTAYWFDFYGSVATGGTISYSNVVTSLIEV